MVYLHTPHCRITRQTLTASHLTVLLDPRDLLLQSERTQSFAADPVYVKGKVFAYVGLPENLKDLKVLQPDRERQEQLALIIDYRGISLIRNRTPLGPYSRRMPRVRGGS